jgi:site-specific DNA recombinase
MNRYIALYGRQSLYKEDSISVETQIEYCKYETHGESYKIYIDKGYSGKDTNRPAFEEMLADLEKGLISRVVVYKLDRISRSILDFSNMMEVFQTFGVEFISTTEKFDTSTPIGRAMLNICIVFAQLERETIQKRIADAYYARSKKGFYMGGRVPYGFGLEKVKIDGINTSKYVPIPEEIEQIELLFSKYSESSTSLGDIIRFFRDNSIGNVRGVPWSTARLSEIMRNPVYVKADADVYNFYKSQGTNIINSIEDFTGNNACYLYKSPSSETSKFNKLADKDLVLAPHEGVIPSKVWLKCRRKCLNNKQSTKPLKAKNSWLVGKVKCGKCDYALTVVKANTKWGRYFVCSNRLNIKTCEGVGKTIYADILEHYMLIAIKRKLKEFNELTADYELSPDPKVNEEKIRLSKLEDEIAQLLNKVGSANETLMKYLNERIEVLDAERAELKKELYRLTNTANDNNFTVISNPADKWKVLSFADRQAVVNALISIIYITENQINITWKI